MHSNTSTTSNNSYSPLHLTPPTLVLTPCASCKSLRRRCAENCLLAPYFPRTDPMKFAIVHKVFGSSNITKMLRALPESQREDAVRSMVYEAKARIRHPVYGCTGIICHLHKQVTALQAELAEAEAELISMQLQIASPASKKTPISSQSQSINDFFYGPETYSSSFGFLDDVSMVDVEPLWT